MFSRSRCTVHSSGLALLATLTLQGGVAGAQAGNSDLVTKVAPAFIAHRDRAQNLLDHLK